MNRSRSPQARQLIIIGSSVLLIGWGAAAAVYVIAGRAESNAAGGYEIIDGQSFPVGGADSRRELQQLERLGGKAAVRTHQFSDWLESLTHGRRLAWTLALCSGAVAGACWYLAGLAEEDLGR
jgi:hypothetical protein